MTVIKAGNFKLKIAALCLAAALLSMTGCSDLIRHAVGGPDKKISDSDSGGDSVPENYQSPYDGAQGSAGSLSGRTLIVSIFTDDAGTSWDWDLSEDNEMIYDTLDNLRISTDYLSEQAANFGASAEFIYDWEMNPDICFFQDHSTDPNYLWGYAKLRRTGTTFVRVGQEHLKFKTGIGVDIFPLDDTPKSLIGQMLLDFYCFCLRKILWSEVAKKNEKGFWKLWFKLINHISADTVHKRIDRMASRSRNDSPNRVRVLLFISNGKLYFKSPLKIRYSMPKKWFTDLSEYEFEGYKFLGTREYDERLVYQYRDYMTLPPEDKRESHIPFSSIDFGDKK